MDEIDHGRELTKFKDFRPTAYDARGLGCEGQEEWRVLISQTRDSDTLTRSNFETAEKLLEEAKAEYELHRFGHWGPGWFEVLVVKPTDEGMKVAGGIVCSLASYPILDDDHHAALENEEKE